MNTHAKAATALLALGLAAIVAYKFAWPHVQERIDRESSDARDIRATLAVGTDNWIGYFPLCSGELRKRMRARGYLVRCEDDKADYAARMQRLRAGELQLAVATIDSYLLNGAGKGFPATIVAVIDESKGGDAVVAWKESIATIDDLKKKDTVKIAFTPGSPSEHLLKAMGVHFDVQALRGGRKGWRQEASGSPDALEKLLARKADVAVVWEPDVTRALANPKVVKLLGSEDVDKLIVDVLLVSRKFSQENPEAVGTLLREYFQVIRHYRENPAQLERDVIEATKLPPEQARASLKGVAWVGLGDNFQLWMGGGGGAEGLVDAIQSTAKILVDSGDFKANPIPDQDPYRIVNRQFLSALYLQAATGGAPANAPAAQSLGKQFKPLSDQQWNALREVGTLKTLPVVFQSGTAELSLEGKQELDAAMENLRHYPNFRVIVKGHTGLRGNPEENLKLSQERAESVGRYLQVTYGVDPNRLRIVGYGSEKPLARLPDEPERAYGYRLPRVELALVSEVL